MTRAEAIKWLEYHIATTDYDKDDDLLKALKYAVRKLKAEPTASTCLGCNCPKMEKLEAEPYIEFCEWVADTVLYEDFEDKWTLGAFAEVACRKLHKLGFVRKDGEYWINDEVKE